MDNKCSKYESLFVFSDKNTLQEHIKNCEVCREEHEKMQKVSNLLDEVKFYYKLKSKRIRKLRAVCALAFIMFFSAGFGVLSTDSDIADALMYGETLNAEDFGFPVDSYGLLVVDDEF